MTDVDIATDPVVAEIEQLRAQVGALTARITALRKLRSRPLVEPVQVYWRHHRERREPYDVFDGDVRSPLEAAYAALEYMADDGQCSAVGVEVGGYLYEQDDLRDMFGEVV